jgi:PDZ domain-containing protein
MNLKIPKTATFILTIFFTLAFLAPLPFVVLTPGNAQNVLAKVITPSKSAPKSLKIYESDGKIFLLSILITNPSAYVTGSELIYSWMRSDYAVMPRSLFYRDGRSAEAEKAIAKTEMVDSQIAAKTAALNFLQENYPNAQSELVRPSDLNISLAKTGGPSGGLAFALGIIELLTAEDILQGRTIATTGTINSDGLVGSIGGIAEKIIAAERAGVTLFLAPAANCKDLAPSVASIPKTMKIAAVNTLEDAILALNSKTPRGCANLGA